MATRYWAVSLPVAQGSSAFSLWSRIQESVSKQAFDTPLYRVFSSWMHFCAVRVFSESILRYGLPPSFLAVVLSPSVKSEKKVRSILEGLCNSSNSTYWKIDDEGGMGGFASDADAHPYVSFTINLI